MSSPAHLRMTEVSLAAGQEWLNESPGWRFIRVTRGAAYWLERDAPRSLNLGEVVVVHPETRALIRASQLNPVVLHTFEFVVDLLCGFFSVSERHLLEQHLKEIHSRFLLSTHPVSERIGSLVEAPEAEPGLVRRAKLLLAVMCFFCDGTPGRDPAAQRELSAQSRFLNVMATMPDLELIRHSSEELAGLCGCSPRHFARLFRSHFGVAPRTKQTELRLIRARQLLMSTEQPVRQVALDSGYRSFSLFNSMFKRHFGVSPSKLRKGGSLSGVNEHEHEDEKNE